MFALLHEIGHMITGIILGFKPSTFDIMPCGLSIGFEGKVDNYNKKIGKTSFITIKKIIIALNGPLTNFLFTLIFILFPITIFGVEREILIYANILIGLFNLIPIYPLDGGRIVKYILKIFYGEKGSEVLIKKISYITVIVLTATSSILVLYLNNFAIVIILAYLWYLVIKKEECVKGAGTK